MDLTLRRSEVDMSHQPRPEDNQRLATSDPNGWSYELEIGRYSLLEVSQQWSSMRMLVHPVRPYNTKLWHYLDRRKESVSSWEVVIKVTWSPGDARHILEIRYTLNPTFIFIFPMLWEEISRRVYVGQLTYTRTNRLTIGISRIKTWIEKKVLLLTTADHQRAQFNQIRADTTRYDCKIHRRWRSKVRRRIHRNCEFQFIDTRG